MSSKSGSVERWVIEDAMGGSFAYCDEAAAREQARLWDVELPAQGPHRVIHLREVDPAPAVAKREMPPEGTRWVWHLSDRSFYDVAVVQGKLTRKYRDGRPDSSEFMHWSLDELCKRKDLWTEHLPPTPAASPAPAPTGYFDPKPESDSQQIVADLRKASPVPVAEVEQAKANPADICVKVCNCGAQDRPDHEPHRRTCNSYQGERITDPVPVAEVPPEVGTKWRGGCGVYEWTANGMTYCGIPSKDSIKLVDSQHGPRIPPPTPATETAESMAERIDEAAGSGEVWLRNIAAIIRADRAAQAAKWEAERGEMNGAVEHLRGQVDGYERRVDILMKALTENDATIADLRAKLAESEAEVSNRDRIIKNLREMNDAMQAENETMNAKLAQPAGGDAWLETARMLLVARAEELPEVVCDVVDATNALHRAHAAVAAERGRAK